MKSDCCICTTYVMYCMSTSWYLDWFPIQSSSFSKITDLRQLIRRANVFDAAQRVNNFLLIRGPQSWSWSEMRWGRRKSVTLIQPGFFTGSYFESGHKWAGIWVTVLQTETGSHHVGLLIRVIGHIHTVEVMLLIGVVLIPFLINWCNFVVLLYLHFLLI